MTRRTTRIAACGAGLLAFGLFSAAPAGASDGAHAGASVSADTADAISRTIGLVNEACLDAASLGGAAASTLSSEQGISVSASPAGGTLGLNVLLPALTDALPDLGSLPVLGGLTGHGDATAPLQISCATAADGTMGLSAAGVDILVNAIAPGIDVSGLDINIPAVEVKGSTTAGSAGAGTAQVSATAAGSLPAATSAKASESSVRAAAAAPATSATTSATASAAPASASGGIVAQTVGSPGALARTGAGVGGLGLLGSFLFGSGRLLGLGRRLLRNG